MLRKLEQETEEKVMIKVCPTENKEWEKEILSGITTLSQNARVIECFNDGVTVGYSAVEVTGTILIIYEMAIEDTLSETDQAFFRDFLLRATASYGENHGAASMQTIDSSMNSFLKSKGFTTDITHAYAPISLIVHYHDTREE